MRFLVFVKQIPDPDIPPTQFRVDPQTNSVLLPSGSSPAISTYDELAVEAALRLRDEQGGEITAVSLCNDPVMNVIKKPLAMGADDLILLQDPAFEGGDAMTTARALAAAARKIGDYDFILCGRQAGDWDNGQVGSYVAELLDIPCIINVGRLEIVNGKVRGERTTRDGKDIVEAPLPALVTAGDEVGVARYPKLRDIMAAGRKQPQVWNVQDLGLDPTTVGEAGAPTKVRRLYVEERASQVEIIEGQTPAEAGKRLALKLRELKII
ncbi:MAG: electron transfer flavoprotein subunit beta/FixA family protein [Chloroflexi bacterium]|nr:electron transfer flavoprotein subunit beta/FixA family protein [Chloroflexota bacterium]